MFIFNDPLLSNMTSYLDQAVLCMSGEELRIKERMPKLFFLSAGRPFLLGGKTAHQERIDLHHSMGTGGWWGARIFVLTALFV